MMSFFLCLFIVNPCVSTNWQSC
uniref:Uncharacterized protein n=1 Tax=Rhizophora mucronata TaxID=61149 RepID=A0A2P2J4N9_RHIMU